MIGDILNAILSECRAFLADTNADNPGTIGTVILKTDFKSDKLATYSMPLILLDMMDGPESRQFIGGGTSMDWVFAMNSYNHSPDAYTDDAVSGGYSAELLDIIDDIREHFSFRQWLSPGMSQIEDNYGFRFTLGGMNRADALQGDGVVMGWRIVFESMAVDQVTDWVGPSTSVLETVVQTGLLILNSIPMGFTDTINAIQNIMPTQITIPANTLLKSMALAPVSGTPTIRIGTTAGGNDVLADTVISEVTIFPDIHEYIATDMIFYISTTLGPGSVNVQFDIVKDYLNFP